MNKQEVVNTIISKPTINYKEYDDEPEDGDDPIFFLNDRADDYDEHDE